MLRYVLIRPLQLPSNRQCTLNLDEDIANRINLALSSH